jgi:phosphoglycerate dehydrogenase-like enzyme
MPKAKVVIANPFPSEWLAELDQGAAVTVLSPDQRALFRNGLNANEEPEARELKRLLAESDAVFAGIDIPTDLLAIAGNLRWLHTTGAGVENQIAAGFGRGSYTFTNGSGPHAIGISEYLVMQALVLIKQLPFYQRAQVERRWGRPRASAQHPSFELYGKTVGIVGLGDIGLAAAERFHALGCRIIGSRRSAKSRQMNVGAVGELVPAGDLAYLLQNSDFVALTLPLTPETRHLINAETLRLMKPTAFLLNISRGGVVDEPALIAALQEGQIAGAGLDVFETEPLPADSPLWQMENVVITPHSSNNSEHFQRRQAELFKENLRRYVAGESLLNVVSADRGY